MARGSQLGRTPIKRKTPKVQPGWAKAVEAVRIRSGGFCEARTPDCTGRHEQTHHVLNRSQGGKADPEILLAVCLRCHDWIGHNRAEAYRLGYSRHNWD